MDYQLEIKQIVDYPRCRIYREFIHTLMADKNIRTNGSSYLFYYMTLCSYANFRSSYRKLEGISYLIGPGEWICKTSELANWFRTRFQHQAVAILDYLQEQNYITYTMLDKGRLIKFSITGWKKHNTVLNYNYPCLKDVGFFFFPIAAVHELISMGKCSEMDIVLDLWVHAIYNDGQVQGSETGPVVYFRNCTGNPLTNYKDLSIRWSISKASVCRVLKKLEEKEYLSLVSFTGRHGSVIYLCSYLSTMFNISDVMIDKEEVSMEFKIPVCLPDEDPASEVFTVKNEQIYVSDTENSVSKSHMEIMVRKVAQILAAQGVSCCECTKTIYKLYRLSDCNRKDSIYILTIGSLCTNVKYNFELLIRPIGKTMEHENNMEIRTEEKRNG